MFPKKLYRVTKHRPPRHQLYQPGFNDANSCWLEGDWITLPRGEWQKRRLDHQRMYNNLNKKASKQHHNGPEIDIEHMTEAQRQAYEFYSGGETIECMLGNYMQCVGIDLSGDKVSKKSIKWLKKKGYLVLRRVRLNDEITDQAEEYSIPEELLIDLEDPDGRPIDWQAKVVEQNMQSMENAFFLYLELCLDESQSEEMRGLVAGTMYATLLMQEEEIIRAEWQEEIGDPDLYTDLARERERYSRMRLELEKVSNWEEGYRVYKGSYNERERENLEKSGGSSYHFVLPEFSSDGSHEPWGKRDVPWNLDK